MQSKLRYADFLQEKPSFEVFKYNKDTIKLFEYLSSYENIEKMKDVSDKNTSINSHPYKSALSVCYKDIETCFGDKVEMYLRNPSIKRGIGVMIRYIMTNHSDKDKYAVMRKENGGNHMDIKSFPKPNNEDKDKESKYFRSASCYVKK